MRQRKKHPFSRINNTIPGGVFLMGRKNNFYSYETKMKAIEMKMSGQFSNREIMDELGLVNGSQIRIWMMWFRKGEMYRFAQPIGKQYSYGKGPDGLTELEQLKRKNQHLEIQLEILKKYQEIERSWYQKSF